MDGVKIYTDGGCSRNGEDDASGICVVYYEGVVSEEEFEPYSLKGVKITNNLMEYMGIKNALKFIRDEEIKDSIISCDNNMVVYSFTKGWRIKSKNLIGLYTQIKEYLKDLENDGFNIEIVWESREHNLAGHYIEERYRL